MRGHSDIADLLAEYVADGGGGASTRVCIWGSPNGFVAVAAAHHSLLPLACPLCGQACQGVDWRRLERRGGWGGWGGRGWGRRLLSDRPLRRRKTPALHRHRVPGLPSPGGRRVNVWGARSLAVRPRPCIPCIPQWRSPHTHPRGCGGGGVAIRPRQWRPGRIPSTLGSILSSWRRGVREAWRGGYKPGGHLVD
jgi:hypothetical protein